MLKAVTFDPTVAIWVKLLVLRLRSILNPVSFVELSDHVRLIWLLEPDAATKLAGAAGVGVGVAVGVGVGVGVGVAVGVGVGFGVGVGVGFPLPER